MLFYVQDRSKILTPGHLVSGPDPAIWSLEWRSELTQDVLPVQESDQDFNGEETCRFQVVCNIFNEFQYIIATLLYYYVFSESSRNFCIAVAQLP